MSDEPPSTAAQMRALTSRLKGISALHGELVSAASALHGLIVFATHPELTELDDEFDNLYPEMGT